MKTRTGFVSNSSSSSFIIGAGLVTDKFAFEVTYPQWYNDRNNGLPDDMEAYSIKQLKEYTRPNSGQVRYETNEDGTVKHIKRVTVESFMYNEVDTPDLSECADDDIVVIYYGGSSLDESDLADYDDDGDFIDYNYDVDYDMFSDDEKEAMDLLSGPLVDGTYEYGAGRNG